MQSDSAWADGVPEPEALLGGNPEYDASLEQLLLLSAQFQELLDKRQTQKWLQLEDAFLRHFALVQNAFYLAGRERTQAQARKEMRALVVELLASYVETQTALRAQSFGAAYSGAAYSGAGRPRAGGCDGRCIDMANALSRLLR